MKLFTGISLQASAHELVYMYVQLSLSFPLLLLLSLWLFWDSLEITIQCHFPASTAQRPVSSTLVMENYQLAQMKWPLERPLKTHRPLPLSLALSTPLYFALPPSQFDSLAPSLSLSIGSTPLKRSMKCISRIRGFAPPAFHPAWSVKW